jgi:DNA replication protein DnaC
MNLTELDPALRKLRLSGMAEHLEMRLLEAQKSEWAAIDLLSALVQDELERRQDRLLARRIKQARFRDAQKTLDGFDFKFNAKTDRALVFELATGRFIERAEDAVFLGAPGTGKSHLAQAIGLAAIHQGHRVAYREVHVLLEELADATLDGNRKKYVTELANVPLLILDDLGMRKLPTDLPGFFGPVLPREWPVLRPGLRASGHIQTASGSEGLNGAAPRCTSAANPRLRPSHRFDS